MDLKHILEIGMEISKGFNVTLSIFFYTLLFSIPLGLILSVFSQSKNKVIYGVVRIYTWILRGTPLMLQIFFIYFGIPIMTGNTVIFDNYTAGLVGFILNYTAYFAEIFRGGIQGIDKGQYEAANALGLTYPKTMLKIVLPQAIRGSLPSIGNEAITLIKDTVLLAI
ncbi:MAG: amino acid ABC transporter permease, partial [Oscillospiraceae bacterium]